MESFGYLKEDGIWRYEHSRSCVNEYHEKVFPYLKNILCSEKGEPFAEEIKSINNRLCWSEEQSQKAHRDLGEYFENQLAGLWKLMRARDRRTYLYRVSWVMSLIGAIYAISLASIFLYLNW